MAEPLTHRERQIAEAYAGGATYKEIARTLGIAPATVRTHLGTVYRKLEISSKIQLLGALGAAPRPEASPSSESRQGAAPGVPNIRTRLIGRETELAELEALLAREDVGLVTLTGPGGSGKTRLGIKIALDVAPAHFDDVHFVELAAVRDPALFCSKVMQVLGVQSTGQRSDHEAIREHLRGKRTLLVLDNFEQILGAAGDVAAILAACPHTKFVVTSRAPLQIRDEHEYPVAPLAVPTEAQSRQLASVGAAPSVRLLVERAQAFDPAFELTRANAETLSQICVRLDGLPLALELAAARLRLLDPATLLSRLDRSLPLLTGGPRDLPDRQRTLRATIEWSHDLLDPPERSLLEALSIFVGGCSFDAADAVSGASQDGIDVLGGIDVLLTQNLLTREQDRTGAFRFVPFETVREFGLTRLEARGARGEFAERHAAFFLAFSERADARIRGPEQVAWLDRIEADHANVRAALAWSLAPGGDPGLGLRLAANLAWFWRLRGHLGEAQGHIEALAEACPERTLPKARALTGLCLMIAGHDPETSRALQHAETALSIARELNDNSAIAWALHALGRCLETWREPERGQRALGESLERFREAGDLVGCAYSGWFLSGYARNAGAFDLGQQHVTRALQDARLSGDPWAIASTILQAGSLALAMDDLDAAETHLKESLSRFHAMDARFGMWWPLMRLCAVAARRQDALRAATLIGAEEALRRSVGMEFDHVHRTQHDRDVDRVRAALPPGVFARAVVRGREMSVDHVVALAVSGGNPCPGDADAGDPFR